MFPHRLDNIWGQHWCFTLLRHVSNGSINNAQAYGQGEGSTARNVIVCLLFVYWMGRWLALPIIKVLTTKHYFVSILYRTLSLISSECIDFWSSNNQIPGTMLLFCGRHA